MTGKMFPFKITGKHTDRFATVYRASRGGWVKETNPEETPPKTSPRGPKTGSPTTR